MDDNSVNIKEEIARLLGEDPRAIQTVKPSREWALRKGIIVKLHISRWRAIVSLTWDDLGLVLPQEDQETLEQRLSLGHKYLLPQKILKEFSSIEYQARTNLARNSFRTHWGYFVPVTSYQNFKETNREYQRRYLQLADEVCREWDSISEKIIYGHEDDAKIAWQTAQKLSLNSRNNEQGNDLETFIEKYVQRLIKNRPSREEFRRSCNYETELVFVPLPGFRAGEQDYAQDLRVKVGIDAKLAKAQAEMEKDVLRQVKEEKEELIDGFYRDVLAQLMSMVERIMRDVQASVRRKKYIPSETADKLRALIDGVRQLNFLNIDKVEEALEPVETLLDGTREIDEPKRDFMMSHTEKIITDFRQDLDRLGYGREGRYEEESPVPEAKDLRRPRLEAEGDIRKPPADSKRRKKRYSKEPSIDQEANVSERG